MIGHPENTDGDLAPAYGLFRMPLDIEEPADDEDLLDTLTGTYYSDVRIDSQYEQMCRNAAA